MSVKMITYDDGETIMRMHYARADIFTKGAVEVSESSLTSSKRNTGNNGDLPYAFDMTAAAGDEDNNVRVFNYVDPVLLLANMTIRAINKRTYLYTRGEPDFIDVIVGVVYCGMNPYRNNAEITYIFPNELAFILPHVALAWREFHSQEQSPTNVKLRCNGPYLHCEISIPSGSAAVFTYHNFGFLSDIGYFIDTPSNGVMEEMYFTAERAITCAQPPGEYRRVIAESLEKADNIFMTSGWMDSQRQLASQLLPKKIPQNFRNELVNGGVFRYPHCDGDVSSIERDVVLDANGPLYIVTVGYIFNSDKSDQAASLLTALENGTNMQSKLLEAGCGAISVHLDTVKIKTLEEVKVCSVLLVKISYREAYMLSPAMRQHYCEETGMVSTSTFIAHIDDIAAVTISDPRQVTVILKNGATVMVDLLTDDRLPFVRWINMLKRLVKMPG